jgi:hypothetical protein
MKFLRSFLTQRRHLKYAPGPRWRLSRFVHSPQTMPVFRRRVNFGQAHIAIFRRAFPSPTSLRLSRPMKGRRDLSFGRVDLFTRRIPADASLSPSRGFHNAFDSDAPRNQYYRVGRLRDPFRMRLTLAEGILCFAVASFGSNFSDSDCHSFSINSQNERPSVLPGAAGRHASGCLLKVRGSNHGATNGSLSGSSLRNLHTLFGFADKPAVHDESMA